MDTGWVTDMAPLGQGAKSKTHQTHVGPPLDEEDGAARVLDPIFTREIRSLSTLSTLSTPSILSHKHMLSDDRLGQWVDGPWCLFQGLQAVFMVMRAEDVDFRAR